MQIRGWSTAVAAWRTGAVGDVVPALVFAVIFTVEWVGFGAAGQRPRPTFVLELVVAGVLVFRRRAPVLSYLVGTAALVGASQLTGRSAGAGPMVPYANLIGLYSLGAWADRRRAWWGLPIAVLGVVGYFVVGAGWSLSQTSAGVLFLWLLAWATGTSTARRRAEHDASRHELRRRVVADERARMARELHDLVGHTVNVMLVQAGAARRAVDRDPGAARELLAGIEDTGRQALDELDRVLGLLRRPEEDDDVGDPDRARDFAADDGRPGVADLALLADRMAGAGLPVTLTVTPPDLRVPAALDLSAYRIVQEALTNSLKHAAARSATVEVRGDADAVEIEVRDDGRGPGPGAAHRPGRGLLGIGERVRLLGGTLEHGGGDGGGYRVRATLPVR